MDITGKHLITRGEFELRLQPHLAAKSPLAGWVSAFMSATFEKLGSMSPNVAKEAIGLQLHDPLTIWYCLDDKNPKWRIATGQDLRVETVGQWTGGMFVSNKRLKPDYEGSEAAEQNNVSSGEMSGNRLRRCMSSPGEDVLGKYLLTRVFGQGDAPS
jgi:inosine-uridine nucleoside N-ribohydrolase